MVKSIVRWDKVDEPISDLSTDVEHEIRVQREAIPLIFIPGIMGSRLRRPGTNGEGTGPDALPNLRWNPGITKNMLWDYSGSSGAYRKAMLVGSAFNSGYLEVDNADTKGNGFRGVMKDYRTKFLNDLRDHDWGPLGKIFEFPVYAFGYNWTDDNKTSGEKLVARIKEIIDEAKKVTGLCEKVILITHSMGGLVARWASQIAGGRGYILGIIHGVQPATGSPAAYWRMKGGFEGLGPTSRIIGHSAHEVTPVLGNTPGGLQLLPNKHYLTNKGSKGWLTITEHGETLSLLPKSDPYEEIYRVKAVVRPATGQRDSTNQYWGLVDPDLLDPDNVLWEARFGNNALDAMFPPARVAWLQYLLMLELAESFHDTLGKKRHPHTFCFWGAGHDTADVIELRIGSTGVGLSPYPERNPYPQRGFHGFHTNTSGTMMMAVLQEPSGDGDGTVPASSGAALDAPGKPAPGDRAVVVEHQPAYEDDKAQEYTEKAVIALCKMRYDALRHPPKVKPEHDKARPE